MRNLSEHPMTYSEAIAILDNLSDDIWNEELIGDVRPYALQWIKEKLLDHQKDEKIGDGE